MWNFSGDKDSYGDVFSSLLCQLLVLGGGTHTDVEQKHSMWLNLQLGRSVEARLLTPAKSMAAVVATLLFAGASSMEM